MFSTHMGLVKDYIKKLCMKEALVYDFEENNRILVAHSVRRECYIFSKADDNKERKRLILVIKCIFNINITIIEKKHLFMMK